MAPPPSRDFEPNGAACNALESGARLPMIRPSGGSSIRAIIFRMQHYERRRQKLIEPPARSIILGDLIELEVQYDW